MGHIIRDSFAGYLNTNDMFGIWSSVISARFSFSAVTRFSVGQSLLTSNSSQSTWVKGVSPRNQATQFAGFSHFPNGITTGTTQGLVVTWWDGATAQCTVVFEQGGNITFFRGDESGTLISTFTTGQPGAIWTQYQIKVVIHPSAGEIHIRKNGNTSDDYSATGLNTRATANSYANQMSIGKGSGAGASAFNIMDLWFWDADTGSAGPFDWLGDFKATQQVPNGDTAQKQFSMNPSTMPNLTVGAVGNAFTVNANTQQSMGNSAGTGSILNALRDVKVTSVDVTFAAGLTANVKVGIYDTTGAGGGPGALLATSNAVVNPVINVNNFVFPSPPTVLTGQAVWFIILSDTNISLSGGGTLNNTYRQSQTYASGFTNPATMVTTGGQARTAGLIIYTSPAGNYANVMELIEDGSTTVVQDANVGHYDLYTITPLSVTPTAILGVSFRMMAAKSDAGARTGAITTLSSATATDSSGVLLSSTFSSQLNMVLDLDPATGLAWTPTAVNNVQFGPKVVS